MAIIAENGNKNSDVAVNGNKKSHVAMFPSAGMGHFMPFMHLARILAANHGLSVTFITTQNNVCPEETAHVRAIASSGLDIRVVELRDRSSTPQNKKEDPFFAKWEAIGRSMVALEELLSTDLLINEAPISAIITDPTLTATLQVTTKLGVPNYILFTVSAFMIGFALYSPVLVSQGCDFGDEELVVNIPAFPPVTAKQIPQALKNKESAYHRVFISSGSDAPKASGFLVNTFHDLEAQFLDGLRSGRVMEGLPPIFPIGPLFLPFKMSLPDEDDTAKACMQWLDCQPAKSVIYVSFGSRSAMSATQITELAMGLERSGKPFLWVLRTCVVASEGRLDHGTVLPPGFESRVGDRGMVVSSWVPQVAILSHGAVGAFVSHCGWNSVIESVCCGVPIVAWPLFGDQMMNARLVVENAKVGVEVNKGEDGIVRREEVERAVKSVIQEEVCDQLRRKAAELAELGRRAVGDGGSSLKSLHEALQSWK